jgi:hypothetical protein
MDIPVTLLVLLALPFVVGGVVLAVSAARRRKAGDPGSGSEPSTVVRPTPPPSRTPRPLPRRGARSKPDEPVVRPRRSRQPTT